MLDRINYTDSVLQVSSIRSESRTSSVNETFYIHNIPYNAGELELAHKNKTLWLNEYDIPNLVYLLLERHKRLIPHPDQLLVDIATKLGYKLEIKDEKENGNQEN